MDKDFNADHAGLQRALKLLIESERLAPNQANWPDAWPQTGLGSEATLELLASVVLNGASHLGAPTAFAHMDPPTPWITWAVTLWNASLNQNLLHPATAPIAREVEARVVAWLSACFGMNGGHMTPGSTVSNLTALWAARECTGVKEVVASQSSHLSIAKSAHLLGMRYHEIPVDSVGAIQFEALPADLSQSALVLTAGTTSTGALDSLDHVGRAAWTHVDAAWAAPLMFSEHYCSRLAGIERADSISISAHKLLFQPKESALVLFRDAAKAHAAVSFGGAYLATPNVGVLGSHGATAIPLLATLLAWGRDGLASRIEHCMELANRFADFVANDSRIELLCPPQTGIVVWRPYDIESINRLYDRLPVGSTSQTTIGGQRWLRNVASNPNADVDTIINSVLQALE
ncbi:pyridoxal phosphate-dependent decarboxylase family protein [Undibacterium sp. JH2W]|uniref:pyridoxal phosphate-dependent decarboxylase family protein n=1 Tax=Undibacterium sp. JH2W TaxID=3413037 RepID=UPI003BF4219B